MSESQSRYSIVERLTQKRLDILSQKFELEEDVKTKAQKVEQLKNELADWESDISQENEKTKRIKQREIEKAEFLSDNAKQRKSGKENVFNEKLSSIDKALERIEEISKTSPTIQN